jgi:hypothetical protein
MKKTRRYVTVTLNLTKTVSFHIIYKLLLIKYSIIRHYILHSWILTA